MINTIAFLYFETESNSSYYTVYPLNILESSSSGYGYDVFSSRLQSVLYPPLSTMLDGHGPSILICFGELHITHSVFIYLFINVHVSQPQS